MRPVADRVARWLVSHRTLLAMAAVLLTVVSVERSRGLEFVKSIDTMFDRSDPSLVPYRRISRAFGSSAVVLAAYDDDALFTSAGIARLRGLATKLGDLPGVASATSLADTPLRDRIIDLDASPMARRLVALMEGYALGADHRTAGVVCVLEPPAPHGATAASQADAIDAIRRCMQDLPSGTVAGEPVMLRDGFAMLKRDGNLLGTTAGLLAGLVLFVSFRSLRWLVVPLAVVLLALWSTRGILALAGLRLTMVSTMLSAMVTVVAIGTTVHVIIGFRRHREAGLAPEMALERTFAELFWPVLGAIATDIIGFGALIFSRVGPVHDFGIMTAIGSAMVLVAVVLAVPWLAIAGRFDADPRRAWGEGVLELGLDRLVKRIIRHPLPILGGSAVCVGIAVVGMRWLAVETDFTKNFRASSPIVASYDMIESRLGGAGVWDLLVPVGPEIDGSTLSRVARLEKRLREGVTVTGPDGRPSPAITKAMSVADVMAALSPISLERLEATSLGNWIVTRAIDMLDTKMPQLSRSLIGTDPIDGSRWLRVMLRARERQPAEAKRSIIRQVRALVADEFPGGDGEPPGEVTGFFVLLAQLVDRMIADQWSTFLLATIGIFLLLSLAFRSPLLGGVALVPNALPIFVVLGLLGWAGTPVNMGTAMIAAVSMGLSVDSSIHYVTAFRRRLHDGHAFQAALETAHQTAGRAMIFSTLALVVGFLALMSSGFIPTVSFGALSCLTLIGGLFGNLVVLPVLLTLLARRIAPGCHQELKSLQLADDERSTA